MKADSAAKSENRTVKCNYCHKISHKIKECRNKKADDEKKQSASQALVASASSVVHDTPLRQWQFDTGATAHGPGAKGFIIEFL